jgi:hypothetical protein
VSAGYGFTLARKSDGSLWDWGWNSSGQLGNGTTTNGFVPAQVAGLTQVSAFSAGAAHSLTVSGAPTPFTLADARIAARIAGGLVGSLPADVARLNVVRTGASSAQIDILDACAIVRKAMGLGANP